MENKWGFLRETEELAKHDGIDKDTGVCRTGLETYLKVLFPDIDDWVHDRKVPELLDDNGKQYGKRPDYRSEKLKMIVEFDGLPHYQNPQNIINDYEKQRIYENNGGYKVVRIPYFVQLTNEVVQMLFGVEVEEKLFDENIPSMGIKGKNTPAFLCCAGVERMAKEFKRFPQQYKVNLEYLKSLEPQELAGSNYLEIEYNKLQET